MRVADTPNTFFIYLFPALFLAILPYSHTITMRLSMLFFTMVLAVIVYRRQRSEIHFPCLRIYLLWAAVAFLSLWGAVEFSYSLNEIKAEIGYGLIAFLGFIVLTRTQQNFVVLAKVLLLSVIVACLWAIASYWHYDKWMTDVYFGGVGDFSTLVVTCLPLFVLLAYLSFKKERTVSHLYWIIAVAVVLYAVLLTDNMMVWLALSAQVFVFLLLVRKGRWKFKLFLILLVGIVFVSAFYAAGKSKGSVNGISSAEFHSMYLNDPRPKNWAMVIEKIENSPWQGKGFGRNTLGNAYPEFRKLELFRHSHNILLDAVIQMGMQGGLVLAAMFVCLIWYFYRLRDVQDSLLTVLAAAGVALVIGVLLKNMTDNFFHRHLALMFWAEMGMLIGLAQYRVRSLAHQ